MPKFSVIEGGGEASDETFSQPDLAVVDGAKNESELSMPEEDTSIIMQNPNAGFTKADRRTATGGPFSAEDPAAGYEPSSGNNYLEPDTEADSKIDSIQNL